MNHTKQILTVVLLSLGLACGDDNAKSSNNTGSNNTNGANNSNNTNGPNNTTQNNSMGSNNQNNAERTCELPDGLEEVEFEVWTHPQCRGIPDGFPRVFTSAEEVLEEVDCDENVDLGVDFSTHRLVHVVVFATEGVEVLGVAKDEEVEGAVKIYTASPRYCPTGADPGGARVFVLIPVDDGEVTGSSCYFGNCN